MNESTVRKICVGVLIVFFVMWLVLTNAKEEKALSDKYKTGYEEGYSEGYAAALSDYGIEK